MAGMGTHTRNKHIVLPVIGRPRSRYWLLPLVAAPAAVAIWSGWVGLGGMSGFGPVNLLPGIGSGLHCLMLALEW